MTVPAEEKEEIVDAQIDPLETEGSLAEEAQEEESLAEGMPSVAEQRRMWEELKANDGKLPEEPVKPDGAAESVVADDDNAAVALATEENARLAELEAQGAAELARRGGEQKPTPVDEPPPGPPVPPREIDRPSAVAPAALDDLAPVDISGVAIPRYVKVGDKLIDVHKELNDLGEETRAVILATIKANANAQSSEQIRAIEDRVAKQEKNQARQDELQSQYEAERAVARLNPEILKINADLNHPFWEFMDKRPGLRIAADKSPEATAEIIGLWQEQAQKAAQAEVAVAAAAERAKSKDRKDMLHTQTGTPRGAPENSKGGAITDEQWAALSTREQRARFNQAKAMSAG